MSGQAQKAIFILNKYSTKFTHLGPSHVLDLFDKLISPILCYSSEVWGFSKAKDVEKVHIQFCKKLLAVKQCTQNDFIYGETGRIPMILRRHYHIIKYWLKVISSSNHKLIKASYEMQLRDINILPNKLNWASEVRDLLFRLGFNEACYNQSVGNEALFLNSLKQRLKDIFIQEWHTRLQESSRDIFYRNFTNFSYKPYLDLLESDILRHSLTRLRTSSHRLEVEVGRWARPEKVPFEHRLCTTCNVLEDEYQFVIICQRYNDLRRKYIKPYYYIRPNMFKFVDLIQSTSLAIVKNLALFVYKAFKERNNYVLVR